MIVKKIIFLSALILLCSSVFAASYDPVQYFNAGKEKFGFIPYDEKVLFKDKDKTEPHFIYKTKTESGHELWSLHLIFTGGLNNNYRLDAKHLDGAKRLYTYDGVSFIYIINNGQLENYAKISPLTYAEKAMEYLNRWQVFAMEKQLYFQMQNGENVRLVRETEYTEISGRLSFGMYLHKFGE